MNHKVGWVMEDKECYKNLFYFLLKC